ncbi:MAG: hypothetical protein KDJ16_03195 [Hyphomicrobiales bacterium]|nr:hypothetical protein [Hyphomicrobiales bacterium]
METRSSLTDGGTPEFADRCGLCDRYRYWLGASGRRHLFTAVDARELPDFSQAVVVLARRDVAGLYVGVDVVCPGDPGEPTSAEVASRSIADPTLAVFVHLLTGNSSARQRMVRDLIEARQKLAA